jgi:hypothetical protein
MTDELITIPAPAATPMGLLEMALQNNASMDTIERLVALQTQMMGRESEMAFNAALNRCQSHMVRVQADASNPQTKSKYATYAALDRAIRPIYTAEGFAISFDTADAGESSLLVIAILSHAAGHSRSYQIPMPNDGKGAKGGDVMTRTHAQGAAVSYGRRYLLCSIFNIAVGENDRDGNTPPSSQQMPEEAFQKHLKAIRTATTNDTLKAAYQAATGECHQSDKDTLLAFGSEKNNRYRELNPGGGK